MSLFHRIRKWNCLLPILIIIAVGVFNFFYFWVLRIVCSKQPQTCDLLNVRVVKAGTTCCSMWPVSHFILFMILGIFFPNCWLPLLLFGALWELIEFSMGFFNKKARKIKNDGKYQYTDKYWAANVFDLFFNAGGFFVGYGFNKLYHKLKKEEEKEEEKEKDTQEETNFSHLFNKYLQAPLGE